SLVLELERWVGRVRADGERPGRDERVVRVVIVFIVTGGGEKRRADQEWREPLQSSIHNEPPSGYRTPWNGGILGSARHSGLRTRSHHQNSRKHRQPCRSRAVLRPVALGASSALGAWGRG